MSKTIVVRKARTPVAFIVVDESQNGTRLLRPTALPVATVETTSKPEPVRPCENLHSAKSEPKQPKRKPRIDELYTRQGSSTFRGNRRQLRELCNTMVSHCYLP